jgi:1,2-phenylacetyl-CoA epoxidase catalytic subunit
VTEAAEPAPQVTQAAATGLFETATDQDAVQRAVAAAAPTSQERADLAMVHTLEAALRAPMAALLESLADNKYVLGRRYAEWCTGAPMLESAVAAAAMAQDELGHARSFYPLLRGFGSSSPQMEERGWQARQPGAMACLDARFATWADFVAANLVVDQALTTLLGAAVESPYEPLRQRARKIVQEEAAHAVHAQGWLRHPGLGPAVARVWDHAFAWFGAHDDPVLGPLAAAGLLAQGPDQLRATLRTRLEPALRQLPDLGAALLAREVPLVPSRWDAAARRLR